MIDALIEQMSEKAPAATMFRSLLERVFSDDGLDEIFNDNRERQLEGQLLFSHLIQMLAPVVSGASKSLNASHQASNCEFSRQAVYDKLKGVESNVASALLRVSTEKLSKVRQSTRMAHKDPIPGFHTFVIDGKTYNATEHRLKETRTDARAPLPGRAIAMLDTRQEMFIDVECDANAHRCERKIAESLLERQLQAGALYMADRNFSDGCLFEIFHRHGAHYIIRQHGACPSWQEIDGEERVLKGKDSQGGTVYEQRIEVRLADGSQVRIRRITVNLVNPTRDGDRQIHILTNLPRRVRAPRVADGYLQRWTIENCFGHLSRSLNAEIRSLCYPGAAGLCFALALVLFNVMSLIRLLILKHGKKSDRYKIVDVSYYYLADEISRSQFAIDELIDRKRWTVFGSMSKTAFAAFLKQTAKNASLARYRKHIRGPNKPKPKRTFNGTRHVATKKILDARK